MQHSGARAYCPVYNLTLDVCSTHVVSWVHRIQPDRKSTRRSAAEWPPRYTVLAVNTTGLLIFGSHSWITQHTWTGIVSLSRQHSINHTHLHTLENPIIEFCSFAALGKSQSHTIKTRCRRLHCRLLVGNNASPIRKFSGPCDLHLDLMTFDISVQEWACQLTRVMAEYLYKNWSF